MGNRILKIASINNVTPDVLQIITNKPVGFDILLFANKTKEDIILESEFKALLGDTFINILSDEEIDGYHYGRVTEAFFKTNVSDLCQQFYICV